MALNRFMHPRNIYKTPPDFAKLAKEFKEFSEIAIVDLSGKFTVDFKNPNSLRVLTKCLLKSDFNVDIKIPDDRLVPTLPLRLNYILWIEDLLNAIQKSDIVIGLDIGTGACAIYPILAAVKNKWQMVGTESDEDSFIIAKTNVEKNNLQDLIILRKNETSSVLNFILQDENVKQFSFCMCNPPFYSTFEDLWESRSPARPPPKNGFTGSPQELITEGGELEFCRRIINESRNHKNKILIFTTMVGHKCNLKELVLDMKANGIKYTTTEFCQGRVTRWGLAWTFQAFEINKLVPSRDKPRKKNVPITFSLPNLQDKLNNIESVKEKFETILQNLNIEYSTVNKRKSNLTLDIVAATNTWSNQRRKRRLMERTQQNEIKKVKLNTNEIHPNASNSTIDDTESSMDVISETKISKNVNQVIANPMVHDAIVNTRCIDDTMSVEMKYIDGSAGKDRIQNTAQEHEIKKIKLDINEIQANVSNSTVDDTREHSKEINPETKISENKKQINTDPIVHAVVNIRNKDNNTIQVEIEYLDGSAGKEGIHQIVQYIKNNWK